MTTSFGGAFPDPMSGNLSDVESDSDSDSDELDSENTSPLASIPTSTYKTKIVEAKSKSPSAAKDSQDINTDINERGKNIKKVGNIYT